MNKEVLHVIVPYFNHTNARVNRRNLELCLRNLSITPECRVVYQWQQLSYWVEYVNCGIWYKCHIVFW